MKRFIRQFLFVLMLVGVPIAALAGPYDVPAVIPDTGQSLCYDSAGSEIACAGTGQDGEFSINPMAFTSLGGGTMVQDNVTGLIWEVKTNKDDIVNYDDPHDADNIYTWHDSNNATNGGVPGTPGDITDTEDFINALNSASFGGYTDWRLPSREELRSIVDYSIPYPGPTIDTSYLPNTVSSSYWSSTTYANSTDNAWYVDFDYGGDYFGNKSSSRYVRAVRGGQSTTTPRFVDNGDNTVTDTRTGLIWEQKTDANINTTYIWQEALGYCNSLDLGGQTDWRLPTIKELASLADLSRYNPAIDPIFENYTVLSDYWTSTTGVNSAENAWYVSFDSGIESYGVFSTKSNSRYVRGVRGGQGGSLDTLSIYRSGSVDPAQALPGDTFNFTNTWEDPDGDHIVDVKLRYMLKGALEWTEHPDTLTPVAGSDPAEFTIEIPITGDPGTYLYQFQASEVDAADDPNSGTRTGTTTWQGDGTFVLEGTIPVGSISGMVLSAEDGKAVSQMMILATNKETGSLEGTATTGQDGSYHIDALRPGQYRVQVYQQSKDYIPQYYRNRYVTESAVAVKVLENKTTPGIDFQLVENERMFDWESRYFSIESTGPAPDPVPAVETPHYGLGIDEATYANNTRSYTIVLATEPTGTVTISLKSEEDNQITISPQTLTFDAINWNIPQSVTVTTVDDDIVEGDHSDYVLHTAESTDADYNEIDIKKVWISIHDDDLPAGTENPFLYFDDNDKDIYEHNPGTGIYFYVRLSATSEKEITVEYSTADGTAKAGEDYVAASGTITFPSGHTSKVVNIEVLEDEIFEPDEFFTLTLKNPQNAELQDETATVRIIDKIVIVTGPAGETFKASETKTLTFKVKNRQNKADDFALHLVSTGGWPAELLSDEIVTIPAQGEIPVEVRLTAPAGSATARIATGRVDPTTVLALTALKQPYTITSSAGYGGTIQPSGTIILFEGEDQTFTFSPVAGYEFSNLLIDGDYSYAVSYTYTFQNITSDHTIKAQFQEIYIPEDPVVPPPPPDPPVLSGTPPSDIYVGQELEFTPGVTGGSGSLTYTIENQPSWAQFDPATGKLSGTPSAADLAAMENITISVTDGIGNGDTLTPFTLTVIQSDIDVETKEDEAVEITLAPERLAEKTYVIVTPPEHGELSDVSDNQVTYRPEENYYGEDRFTFKIEGRPDSDAAAASLTITPINDPPVAAAGDDLSVEEESEIRLSAADSADPLDPEGTISDYQWVQTEGPTVEIRTTDTPGEALFTAPEVESGSVSLTFQLMVTDDGGLTAADEITVTAFHNTPPDMPILYSPQNRAAVPAGDVTLQASPFADVDEDAHARSRWELRRYDRVYGAPEYDPAFDQLVTEGDLASYTVSGLASGLKYGWRVTYGDPLGKMTPSMEYTFKVGTSVARDRILYGGKKPAHFPMVSFDQWPDNPSCMAVFGAEMGGEYDTRSYRIAGYDPVSNQYLECDEGLMIEPGRAYWFFTLDRITLTVNGIPVSRDHDLEVRLRYSEGTRNGWNMIAAPNGGDYQWADVEVIEYDGDGNIIFGPTAVGELAAENEYLDKQLWRWVDDKADGKYESGTTAMLRNNGYWIRAKKGGVFLRFPKAAQKNLGGGGAVVKNMLEHGKEWIGAHLPTVSEAVAGSTDTPPRPISGFEADTGADSSGGGSAGCFVKTAEE